MSHRIYIIGFCTALIFAIAMIIESCRRNRAEERRIRVDVAAHQTVELLSRETEKPNRIVRKEKLRIRIEAPFIEETAVAHLVNDAYTKMSEWLTDIGCRRIAGKPELWLVYVCSTLDDLLRFEEMYDCDSGYEGRPADSAGTVLPEQGEYTGGYYANRGIIGIRVLEHNNLAWHLVHEVCHHIEQEYLPGDTVSASFKEGFAELVTSWYFFGRWAKENPEILLYRRYTEIAPKSPVESIGLRGLIDTVVPSQSERGEKQRVFAQSWLQCSLLLPKPWDCGLASVSLLRGLNQGTKLWELIHEVYPHLARGEPLVRQRFTNNLGFSWEGGIVAWLDEGKLGVMLRRKQQCSITLSERVSGSVFLEVLCLAGNVSEIGVVARGNDGKSPYLECRVDVNANVARIDNRRRERELILEPELQIESLQLNVLSEGGYSFGINGNVIISGDCDRVEGTACGAVLASTSGDFLCGETTVIGVRAMP